MRRFFFLLILSVNLFFLTGCPVYDPPSRIVDSRLKIANHSDYYLQYLCSCDTINGDKFESLAATISSGVVVAPKDTFDIPGWDHWDNMISQCPENKLTVYIYTFDNDIDTTAGVSISNQYHWTVIHNNDLHAEVKNYSITDLESINWILTFK